MVTTAYHSLAPSTGHLLPFDSRHDLHPAVHPNQIHANSNQMLAHQRHPSSQQNNDYHDAYSNPARYRNGSIAGSSSSSHQHQQPELFVGTFDFETTEPDQVSFKRGTVLPIVLKEPSGWWAAQVNGRYGWVPAAFLEPWVPPNVNSGASPLSPASSMASSGGAASRRIGRGSVTAESVADLPLYSEEDTYDNAGRLSPEHEHEYYHDPDTGHLRHRLSSSDSYTDEPTSSLRSIDDYGDGGDGEDPLVSDLVAHFSGAGIGHERKSGSGGGALPAYARHSPQSSQSPTSFNNYSMTPRAGGGDGGGHAYANAGRGGDFYAPPYDPPVPHQLSLVIEEGSDVNSQWSMPHSSQAFSTTSSASAMKKQQQQRGGTGTGGKGGSAYGAMHARTHSGSQRSPTSPSNTSSSPTSTSVSTAALQRQRIAHSSTPWYLRPKHAWDELKLDADGLVAAGTVPALMERLVMDSTIPPVQETAFRHTLLATIRVWTTAEALYDTLVGHYMMSEPEGMSTPEQLEWKEKKIRPTQMRVLCVFGLWIEKYGLLVDEPKLVPRLRTWLSTILSPTGLALSAKQLVQSIDRIQNADDTAHQPSTSPSGFSLHLGASLRRKPKPPKSDFLKWDASDVANHLTLSEARAYGRIRPCECLAWTRVGGKVKKDAAGMTVTDDGVTAGKGGDAEGGAAEVKNLMAFVARSDRLAMWVKNTVLCCESLGRRADMIDFWIKIAERCRNLNNIFSMSAIVAALSGGDVGKLHLTWAHVSRASNFEQLVKLTDPTGNFSAYRTLHASLSNQADGSNASSIVNFAGTSLTGGGGSSVLSTSPSTLASTSPTSVLSLSPTRDGPSASNIGPPCVPFISPFLTELMHINDHYPSTIPTPQGPEPSQAPPRPLINVVKLQRQADVILNILRFVDRLHLTGVGTPTGSTSSGSGKGSLTEGYRVIAEKENPALASAMEAQMEAAAVEARKDAGYFWKRSQELQGMEVTHADIWKNLNDAGF